MCDFAFISKLQEFVVFHLWPKSVLYSTAVCCADVVLLDDRTESHGSFLAAEVMYLKRTFLYILYTTSDLKLSLDKYVT